MKTNFDVFIFTTIHESTEQRNKTQSQFLTQTSDKDNKIQESHHFRENVHSLAIVAITSFAKS